MTVSGLPSAAHGIAIDSRWGFYRSVWRKHWKAFVGMMALVLVYSGITAGRVLGVGVIDVVRARFTNETGDFLRKVDEIYQSLLGPGTASLADRIRADNDFFIKFLLVILGVFTLASIVMAVSFYVKECLAQVLNLRIEVDLRRALHRHLMGQSVAYFHRQRSGDLISRLTNDITAVRLSFKLFFEDVVQQPVTIIFSLVLAFSASPILFAISMPFYVILLLPIFRAGRKVIKHGRGRLEKLGVLTDAIQQLFSGIRIVKAFGMERREEEEFTGMNDGFVRTSMKMTRAKLKARSMQEFLYNFGTAAGILIGVVLITMKFLDITRFLVFMGCMVQLYMPLKALSNAWNQMQESRGGLDRILEVLRERPLIVDRHGSLEFPGAFQEIRFERVSFSYGELDPSLVRTMDGELHLPVLHDISFTAAAGQVVALVGPSGSGKSTIADLLARFYDPQRGAILIDGGDLRDYQLSSYLEAIAIVSQEPFLFNTSIRENIRYGREDATPAEIEEAARVAFAHEFILEQPQGYDTVIGERGVKLSGGQRQRLTIARAVLKNAPILILDEATSSLDSQAEKEVQRAIDNLIRSRTTLVIAHRLSTVAHADKILVLDGGRIVEEGGHDELLKARGLYHGLWRSQNPEA